VSGFRKERYVRDSTEARRCKGCGTEYYTTHPDECEECIEYEYQEVVRSGDCDVARKERSDEGA